MQWYFSMPPSPSPSRSICRDPLTMVAAEGPGERLAGDDSKFNYDRVTVTERLTRTAKSICSKSPAPGPASQSSLFSGRIAAGGHGAPTGPFHGGERLDRRRRGREGGASESLPAASPGLLATNSAINQSS